MNNLIYNKTDTDQLNLILSITYSDPFTFVIWCIPKWNGIFNEENMYDWTFIHQELILSWKEGVTNENQNEKDLW